MTSHDSLLRKVETGLTGTHTNVDLYLRLKRDLPPAFRVALLVTYLTVIFQSAKLVLFIVIARGMDGRILRVKFRSMIPSTGV